MGVSAGRATIIEAKPEPLTVNCSETGRDRCGHAERLLFEGWTV
jgi:hypothetical protein